MLWDSYSKLLCLFVYTGPHQEGEHEFQKWVFLREFIQVAQGFHNLCVLFGGRGAGGNDQSRLAICGRKPPWVSGICLPLSLSKSRQLHTGPCVERASEEVGKQLHAVSDLTGARQGRSAQCNPVLCTPLLILGAGFTRQAPWPPTNE